MSKIRLIIEWIAFNDKMQMASVFEGLIYLKVKEDGPNRYVASIDGATVIGIAAVFTKLEYAQSAAERVLMKKLLGND